MSWVKCQTAQPAAQLRLADPAVAEKQDLDLRVDPLAGPQGPRSGRGLYLRHFGSFISPQTSDGKIIQLAAKQVESSTWAARIRAGQTG